MKSFGNRSDIVSIVRHSNDVSLSIQKGLGLIENFHHDRSTVVIKPNICVEQDALGGATTSIIIVKAMIDAVLKKDANTMVKIVESDSSGKWIDKAYTNFGYVRMADRYREVGHAVELINLSNVPAVEISTKYSPYRLHLPEMLLLPHYFISIAKAKTHVLCDLTGVLKNQFGCIPRKDKFVYHNSIDKVIVEVNEHIKPDLCVVDAVKGVQGFIHGKTHKIGALIFGRNPVSTDAVLAKVIGFDPMKVGHIALASRARLGNLHPKTVGVPISEIAIKLG